MSQLRVPFLPLGPSAGPARPGQLSPVPPRLSSDRSTLSTSLPLPGHCTRNALAFRDPLPPGFSTSHVLLYVVN